MDLQMIEQIRDKKIDIESYASKIIADQSFREQVIEQLLTNKDIMVYYHCYYIVSKASEERPELFYAYWNDFIALLEHKNSYHRDMGITIIANLVQVDQEHYFDDLFEEYLTRMKDEKFMTAQCCVKNLMKIVKIRMDLRDKITDILLNIDRTSMYAEKQKELLKYDILCIFEMLYDTSGLKHQIRDFTKGAINSMSPKTRKKAKAIIGEMGGL